MVSAKLVAPRAAHATTLANSPPNGRPRSTPAAWTRDAQQLDIGGFGADFRVLGVRLAFGRILLISRRVTYFAATKIDISAPCDEINIFSAQTSTRAVLVQSHVTSLMCGGVIPPNSANS